MRALRAGNRVAFYRLTSRAAVSAVSAAVLLLALGTPGGGKGPFTRLADGIEMAEFPVPGPQESADTMLLVVRIDPAKYEIRLLGVSNTKEREAMTARQWCDKYGLIGAINAGMFDDDNRTHVGYMRAGDHVHNAKANEYKSAAAFDPKKKGLPPFRIYELDVDKLGAVKQRYRSVVQNLRLIKRPGVNRWPKGEKRWSEAALGEDKQGRMLWIFCREPLTMNAFNRLLMSLPIGLVSAQHLEGGPEAQLYLEGDEGVVERVGSYESVFYPWDRNFLDWPIPNVIGIAKKR